jgi:signal transduction histidine kinase
MLPLSRVEDGLQERVRALEDTHQALLNILEDFAAEKAHLEEVQRAVINILEDFDHEKKRVKMANRELRRQIRERERAEEELSKHRNHLEALVQERTTELQISNRQLLEEVAERRRAEDAVKRINAELERLSRMKDEFLSLASHELKTPVTSIRLFSELVARHPNAVQPRLVQTILRQSAQLTQLINDLLDVSRLQLGRMPVEMRPLDLNELLTEICERRRQVVESHIVLCLAEEAAIKVQGDPVRLEQVFTNLIDNAVKYSPKGSRIGVRVRRLDGHALVEVADQGIGIAPEHLPHIFERFYKPGPQQAAYTGLGVGLYISREIVERHGGRIWAESEVGKGSTFTVELPLSS